LFNYTAQIDFLSEDQDNKPTTKNQGLLIMPPPSARSKKETVQQQAEAREAKRRQENARKARQAADQEFPNEKWKSVEAGIYLSPNRPTGAKSNYGDELRDAQILRDLGSTVYLVPEIRHTTGKKFDAIVNGLQFEFKNISGNENTLQTQFLRSRSQAPNVFINLETSHMTKRQTISALFGARNRRESAKSHGYNHYNKFKGGKIIIKIRDQKHLFYLNVDGLKLTK
jgi:hypothetical protein